MKTAIILNSGTGSRLGNLTSNLPKCLVKIADNETILSRQLFSLKRMEINNIIITTGPFENKIKRYIKSKFSSLNISYVNNPLFRETNYIYSLLLAGESVNESVILLHGDLVFETAVLKKLIDSPYSDAVLVNPHIVPPKKDFKVKTCCDLAKNISVDLAGDNCVFLIPFYKLTKEFLYTWIQEIKIFREKGELLVYAENALNNLLHDLSLHLVELSNEFCMEVDDLEDLEVARKHLSTIEGV